MSIRALGGGDLVGDKPVLFVYLDETGTGDPKVEPFVIIAGVMVKADKKWKTVEERLKKIANEFALPEERYNFFFHANELFTGGKKEFREKYSLQKRFQALIALCSVPEEFDLPIFTYAVHRARYAQRRPIGLSANELLTEALMHCSVVCATQIEQFVREHYDDDEVVTLVYENNSDKNYWIKEYHKLFRSDVIENELKRLKVKRLSRFERIIEAPMFSGKTDSSLLQIADACAYVIGRKLRGIGIPNDMWKPVRRQLKAGVLDLMREPV